MGCAPPNDFGSGYEQRECQDFRDHSSTVHDRCGPVARRLKRDTPEGRAAVEQLVWSQIHGKSHRMICGKLQREGGSDYESFAAALDLASVLLPGVIGGKAISSNLLSNAPELPPKYNANSSEAAIAQPVASICLGSALFLDQE